MARGRGGVGVSKVFQGALEEGLERVAASRPARLARPGRQQERRRCPCARRCLLALSAGALPSPRAFAVASPALPRVVRRKRS